MRKCVNVLMCECALRVCECVNVLMWECGNALVFFRNANETSPWCAVDFANSAQ